MEIKQCFAFKSYTIKLFHGERPFLLGVGYFILRLAEHSFTVVPALVPTFQEYNISIYTHELGSCILHTFRNSAKWILGAVGDRNGLAMFYFLSPRHFCAKSSADGKGNQNGGKDGGFHDGAMNMNVKKMNGVMLIRFTMSI